MASTDGSIPGMLPLGQSTVPGGIELTMGMFGMATVICSFLTGILTVQVYNYYTKYTHDSLGLKFLVAMIFFLDLGQLFSLMDLFWWYLVRNWGNLAGLAILRVSMGWTVLFGVLVVLAVQVMFLYRVYALTESLAGALIAVTPIGILIVLETAFGLRLTAFGLKTAPLTDLIAGEAENRYATAIWLGCGVAADILLSGMLCQHLMVKKTGFKTTDTFIARLIAYSINTCLLTSTVAMVDLILYFTMPDNNVHFFFNTLLGKLFSNSLLSSLNMRKTGRYTFATDGSTNLDATEASMHIEPSPIHGRGYFSESDTEGGIRERKSPIAPTPEPDDVQMYPLQGKALRVLYES